MATDTATTTSLLPPLSPITFEPKFPYSDNLSTLSVSGLAAKPQDERQRLVQRCTGETIHVENLMSLMPSWFKKIHDQSVLNEVNTIIDEWLKK